MFKSLLMVVALGFLPGTAEVEVRSEPTPTPELVPGHPARQLFTRSFEGRAVQVWGWEDTEGIVHWLASENPHIKVAAPASHSKLESPSWAENGVELNRSPAAVHRSVAASQGYQVGAMTTNDRSFGPAFYQAKTTATSSGHQDHPGKPCPGPGPCPNPSPPKPTPGPIDPRAPINYRDYLFLGAAAAVVGFLVYRKRKGL